MNFCPLLFALFFGFSQILFAQAEREECRKAIVEDRCHDKETRWYYDTRDKDCRKFWGCRGPDNNFHSKDECEDKCEDHDNRCRGKNCDDCEKCINGRCVHDFRNFFCRRRFEHRIPLEIELRPSLPLIVPPIVAPLPAVIPPAAPSDPCDNIICGKCQRCDTGICISDQACSINACVGIVCGACQRCEDGICIHNQGCIVSPPEVVVVDVVDACAGVRCPECYTCSRGQCVRDAGCREFNFGRCFDDFRCGPCRACVAGWCVPRRDGICEAREGRPLVFGRLARGIEHLENEIVDQDRQDLKQLNRLDNRFDRDFFWGKK